MSVPEIPTLNLSDDGDGMVSLNDNPTTSFRTDKNMSQNKETTTMDSTPINDIMMEPPMMQEEPRMQGMMPQMTAPQPQAAYVPAPAPPAPAESKHPFNLNDEQMTALIVATCTAIAISKPVQDKLATSIPKFINEQGVGVLLV